MAYFRVGNEYRSGTVQRGFNPDTAPVGGGYVVAWIYRGSNSGTVDVLAQRYTDGGEKLGPEILVNSTTAGEQDEADVSPLAGGGFVVTWVDGSFQDSMTIRAQLFDAQGGRVGGELVVGNVVGSTSINDQINPEIVQLAGGRLMAVWTSSDGDGFGVKAQLLDAAGNKIGTEFTVNQTTAAGQEVSDVVALANGNSVVTWIDFSGQSSEPISVKGQIFDSNGQRVGGEFLVNNFNGGSNRGGTLAALDNGNFISSWTNATGSFIQLFDSGGQRIGNAIAVPRSDFKITDLDSGGFLIVSNGGSTGIYVQVYDAAGNTVGAEFKVNTGGFQTSSPNAVELPSGDIIITWGDRAGGTSSNFNIQNQIFQLSSLDPAPTANPDILVGTALGDYIDGLAGNDTISGGDGDDVLIGGSGNNVLSGDAGNDILSLSGPGQNAVQGGTGSDILILNWGDTSYRITGTASADNTSPGAFQANFSASPNTPGEIPVPERSAIGLGFEKFWITAGSGSDDITTGNGADIVYGFAGDDRIDTQGGNDYLDGGAGADQLIGGPGDDIYIVDDLADVTTEIQNGGTDEIRTYLQTFDLTTRFNIENLTGLGEVDNILTGNPFANQIIGGAGNDQLFGVDGDDQLIGGTGIDRTDGGRGNDTHYVDSAGDVVIERVGEGRDTVFASVSYALSPDTDVEVLSAINHAATDAINLIGNQLDNTLFGNAGSNVLNGAGGADFMIGFGGNDTYGVDNIGDVAFEVAGGGYDTVFTSVSYELTAGSEVEALSASSQASTNAINLVGNEFANTLFGNAGNNVLNGAGGADVLIGFGGNDTYGVDNAGDVVIEAAGGGYDTVFTSVNYALAPDSEVEALSASNHAATNAIDLTGNGIANTLFGNAGANTLNGGGGNDVLLGFGGADTYAFTTALGAGNVDAIVGFGSVDDTIALDDSVFSGLALGALNANAFVAGTAALDADDRIIYDSATGRIFFDADGNGAGAAVLFATVEPGTTITAGDFFVI